MDLDELLDASAPPTAARTPAVRAELHHLVAASESVRRPRRARARFAVAGAIAAGLVGVGTVASAAGLMPGWTDWRTSAGSACEIQASVSLRTDGDGEPITKTFTVAEQRRTLASARAFLEDFDYGAVDRQAAIDAWQAAEAKARADQPDPAERQPKLDGDDLEVQALMWEVETQLERHLDAQGLDLRALAFTTGNRCDR